MNIFKLFITFILFSSLAHLSLAIAKEVLLDKTILVINDKVFTKSQVDRIKENFEARKSFSPRVYAFEPNDKNIVEELIQEEIIKNHLSTIGFVVSDSHINEQIKTTERNLRINRDQLLDYLKRNNVTFDEYFSVVGKTLEKDLFITRTIMPLISITDQQIKNEFFQRNKNNSAIAFNFNLISYSIDKNNISDKKLLDSFPSAIKEFKAKNVLAPEYAGLSVNELGEVNEESLDKQTIDILNNTEEGDFTKPILIGNQYHVFLIKKKDLVESEAYLKQKDMIQQQLFEKEAQKVTDLWFKKEKEKNHITFF